MSCRPRHFALYFAIVALGGSGGSENPGLDSNGPNHPLCIQGAAKS